MVGIRVYLQAVLDLTSPPSVLKPLNLDELGGENWRKVNDEQKESRSQALGRAVADLGEGVLARSRRKAAMPEGLKPAEMPATSKAKRNDASGLGSSQASGASEGSHRDGAIQLTRTKCCLARNRLVLIVLNLG